MRTFVFLPTLLALGLASGAALADKSHGAMDRGRARGDVLDKSYRAAQSHGSPQGSEHVGVNVPAAPQADHSTSRVTCSEMGADCHQHATRAGGPSERAVHSSAARAPSFLDKVLGSDRTNINEAGESQGMSGRAAQRAWSHAGAGAARGATMPLARQQQHARAGEQASGNRMSCNDADECMMSSKGAKKEWSYTSIKAGTWKGPEAAPAAAIATPAAAAPRAERVRVTMGTRERATKPDAPSPKSESDHE